MTCEKKPESVLSYLRPNGKRCNHHYLCDVRMKYWGGLLPTIEYYYRSITWRLASVDDFAEKPYPITRNMKLIKSMDEFGNEYDQVKQP